MSQEISLPNLDVAMSILEQLPEALVVSSDDKKTLWCNDAFAKIVGSQSAELKNRPLDEIMQTALSPVQNMKDVYCGIVAGDNTQRWYEKRPVALNISGNNGDGQLSAQLLIDVSDRMQSQIECKKLQEKLDELTTIEPVSGLLNARAMMQSLEPLVSRSRRYENPLSLIAINLLNLSLLVDRHGRETADEAVVALSHLLRDQLRWADIVCRYDDTRIIVILPETAQEDALFLANKILGHVDEMEIRDKNNSHLELDTCYGVTGWQKGDDSRLLLSRVQKALDTATRNGSKSIIDLGQ